MFLDLQTWTSLCHPVTQSPEPERHCTDSDPQPQGFTLNSEVKPATDNARLRSIGMAMTMSWLAPCSLSKQFGVEGLMPKSEKPEGRHAFSWVKGLGKGPRALCASDGQGAVPNASFSLFGFGAPRRPDELRMAHAAFKCQQMPTGRKLETRYRRQGRTCCSIRSVDVSVVLSRLQWSHGHPTTWVSRS